MDSMRRWYEASLRRFSVRRYKAAPEEAQLQALVGMAELLCAHGVRIAWRGGTRVQAGVPLVRQGAGNGYVRGGHCERGRSA